MRGCPRWTKEVSIFGARKILLIFSVSVKGTLFLLKRIAHLHQLGVWPKFWQNWPKILDIYIVSASHMLALPQTIRSSANMRQWIGRANPLLTLWLKHHFLEHRSIGDSKLGFPILSLVLMYHGIISFLFTSSRASLQTSGGVGGLNGQFFQHRGAPSVHGAEVPSFYRVP